MLVHQRVFPVIGHVQRPFYQDIHMTQLVLAIA